MNTIQGRAEVQEAVLVAALSAVVTGLIHWGFDHLKRKLDAPSRDNTVRVDWYDRKAEDA